MKVLDVYSKVDLDLFTDKGQSIESMMDSFFSNFPSSYRENYDKNIETLEIYRVDEMIDPNDSAEYFPVSNVLMFKSFAAIPHELMHMTSYDRVKEKTAFMHSGISSLVENALYEGMTEYLSCVAKNGHPNTYFFEYFVVSMLSDIDGIFEPYFIPSYNKFISLFPNKRDIISLMYALENYQNRINILTDDSSELEIAMVDDCVKSVIDNLIDIELSFNKNKLERKIYADKFMGLIANPDLKSLVSDVSPEYLDYAHHEVKKRILGRKR